MLQQCQKVLAKAPSTHDPKRTSEPSLLFENGGLTATTHASGMCMKRRDFIAGTWNAAVMPFAVRAQTAPMPVVGLLASSSSNEPSGLPGDQSRAQTGGEAIKRSVWKTATRTINTTGCRLLSQSSRRFPPLSSSQPADPRPHRRQSRDDDDTDRVRSDVGPGDRGPCRQPNRPGGNITGISALTVSLIPNGWSYACTNFAPGAIGALVNPRTGPATKI